MEQFPIWLTLRDRAVVVVGGGTLAAAKARLAAAAQARVTFVAPALEAAAAALVGAGDARHAHRRFETRDAAGAAIVFIATGDRQEDDRVAAAAASACALVNVVDRPELSTFSMPAIVDRGPVVLGISTGGAAPALAAHVRDRVEAALPPRLGALARFAGVFRDAVRARVPEPAARRRFWNRVLDGPIAAAVLDGREDEARSRMLRGLNRNDKADAAGIVSLVGAGPGDAELLTLRALRRIQAADVLVYDRLVSSAVLAYARRDVERLYVGKEAGQPSVPQDRIHALMAARARAGRRVVRLKGGDPFVFGRGGEELEALTDQGIAVEVVPGISAALGCAAAAGVPLTHRDLADSVTLVAGNGRAGSPEPDWAALARARDTVVVYMGVARAARIAARLIEGGAAPATPAAVVENGTRPDQRVFAGRLDGLADLVRRHAVRPPAVLIVGAVAARAQRAAAVAGHGRAAAGGRP